ncbi:hypothetical protein CHS0354_002085 [Potamilus streckersoni]|uniref:Uncharacterized protein n=1 Tax=Potamilus streckersoni TaxID=2493646 RepID=A0AAE0W8G1_9BIVA|nr:hypothetical protein CHS0354_002085 [Potamilus streckersoni]
MSERYKDALFEELPEIDGLIDLTGGKGATQLSGFKPKYSPKNFDAARVLSTQRHYAYLKISEGCSNMCSFCNIPFLRGNFSSRPVPHVVSEFTRLLDMGIREINLISQDSSSYGADLPKEHNLLNLTEKLLSAARERECWIRIFYSYPNRYPKEMFRLMKTDPRLVPYIDMPFQHISDTVLRDMNRRITGDKIRAILDDALEILPDLAVRTTFIVGFPTETEDNFEELLNFVKQGYFRHIISARQNLVTQSREGEKHAPEADNGGTAENFTEENKSAVGQVIPVLIKGVSEESDLLIEGRACFQGVDVDGVVYINEGEAVPGSFTQVRITEAHPYDLIGTTLI